MKLYNLKEVSELLGLALPTIRLYIKNGKLKASKVGNHYVVTDEAIKELLKSKEVKPKK